MKRHQQQNEKYECERKVYEKIKIRVSTNKFMYFVCKFFKNSISKMIKMLNNEHDDELRKKLHWIYELLYEFSYIFFGWTKHLHQQQQITRKTAAVDKKVNFFIIFN